MMTDVRRLVLELRHSMSGLGLYCHNSPSPVTITSDTVTRVTVPPYITHLTALLSLSGHASMASHKRTISPSPPSVMFSEGASSEEMTRPPVKP